MLKIKRYVSLLRKLVIKIKNLLFELNTNIIILSVLSSTVLILLVNNDYIMPGFIEMVLRRRRRCLRQVRNRIIIVGMNDWEREGGRERAKSRIYSFCCEHRRRCRRAQLTAMLYNNNNIMKERDGSSGVGEKRNFTAYTMRVLEWPEKEKKKWIKKSPHTTVDCE